MQSVSELTNLQGKKVILRLDLNVPLKNGEITDTTRIDKVLPTIEFLLKQNSKIIILSHVGRPKGKVIKDLSLKPIQEDIEKKNTEVARTHRGLCVSPHSTCHTVSPISTRPAAQPLRLPEASIYLIQNPDNRKGRHRENP